jgi:hypothetical protein
MRHILYLTSVSFVIIVIALFAKLSIIFGSVEYNIFLGMFVPTVILLRNGIRSFLLPLKEFDPFSGTCNDDSIIFKRWNFYICFGNIIIGILILRF